MQDRKGDKHLGDPTGTSTLLCFFLQKTGFPDRSGMTFMSQKWCLGVLVQTYWMTEKWLFSVSDHHTTSNLPFISMMNPSVP